MNGEPSTFVESQVFLQSLFCEDDKVLVRPIETWTADNRKHSRVDFKGIRYLTSGGLVAGLKFAEARSQHEMTNTFFGVCPRFGTGGKYDKAWQIRTVRTLWADIDHVTVEEAINRVAEAGLPHPSIIVSSGNGVHLYWILDAPFLIDDVRDPPPVLVEWVKIHSKKKRIEYYIDSDNERINLHDPLIGKPLKRNEPEPSPKATLIQDILQGMAVPIGGDHTFDLSRILRIPGTLNRKDQRNGKAPLPCVMIENNGQRYSIDLFEKFATASPVRQQREKIKTVPLPSRKRMTGKRQDKLGSLIWACDNAQAGDRSEADYRLCCWCIEHGLTASEVWAKVENVGKFKERGEDYFNRTWGKAETQVRCTIATCAEHAAGTHKNANAENKSFDSADGRIEIEVTTKEHDINNQVIDVLRADDSLYQRGAQLVTVISGKQSDGVIDRPEGVPRIAAIGLATIRETISKFVDFFALVEVDGEPQQRPQHPPDWCCRAVHARGNYPSIRELAGIVNHPVIKPDGSIQTQPGYDPQTELILHWTGEPIQVISEPTLDDAREAIQRLKYIVSDFPFESDAHRAGWLALLLTAFIRHSFRHAITVPLFLIDASVRGSGKTLLFDIVGIVVCGAPMPRMIYPKDDDELRKHMLCLMMAGDEFALFDNVSGDLGGQTLDAALTGTVFKGRILGESREVSVEINTTFGATSNNCTVNGDLCRRAIPIRLNSAVENPEERKDFLIPDILQYVRQHRRELLIDALTVLRAYWVAEKPDVSLSAMGSFEDWSAAVRGPLVWAGEPDPWETRIEFAKRADSGVQTLAEILRNWQTADPDDHGMTVADLLQRLDANPHYHAGLKHAVCDLCNCKSGSMPSPKLLGKRLGSIRDRIYQAQKLTSRENRNGILVWRVEKAEMPVRGLRGVAGCFSGTSREETGDKGSEIEKTDAYTGTPYEDGAAETPPDPANPAKMYSTDWD